MDEGQQQLGGFVEPLASHPGREGGERLSEGQARWKWDALSRVDQLDLGCGRATPSDARHRPSEAIRVPDPFESGPNQGRSGAPSAERVLRVFRWASSKEW